METFLEQCITNATQNKSRLTLDLLTMEGMTGQKTRHFYNNLVSKPGARYLEIGVHKGSSFCSAIYGNTSLETAVAIDNWSEFGNVLNEFITNMNRFKPNDHVQFIESDCFNVDPLSLPKFNIYMYDGNHEYEAHKKALTHFYPCLDNEFIYVIDDWNWEFVRQGTLDAIKELNLFITWQKEIVSPFNGHPDWWNGMGIFVLVKN
jgi:hypothetical protein